VGAAVIAVFYFLLHQSILNAVRSIDSATFYSQYLTRSAKLWVIYVPAGGFKAVRGDKGGVCSWFEVIIGRDCDVD
jgi:hypothetical protein